MRHEKYLAMEADGVPLAAILDAHEADLVAFLADVEDDFLDVYENGGL